MNLVNHQFRLAARPVGMPKRSDWAYTEEPVAEPGDGELLVKILYISLDPAMRGWMNEGRSYIPPVEIGAVMRALAVGPRDRFQEPQVCRRRSRLGQSGRSGICPLQRRRPHQDRHQRRAACRSG